MTRKQVARLAAACNEAGCGMCEKCKPIDDKIAHYQFLRSAVLDQQTVDGIEQLMQELEMQKKELHPEMGHDTTDPQ